MRVWVRVRVRVCGCEGMRGSTELGYLREYGYVVAESKVASLRASHLSVEQPSPFDHGVGLHTHHVHLPLLRLHLDLAVGGRVMRHLEPIAQLVPICSERADAHNRRVRIGDQPAGRIEPNAMHDLGHRRALQLVARLRG